MSTIIIMISFALLIFFTDYLLFGKKVFNALLITLIYILVSLLLELLLNLIL